MGFWDDIKDELVNAGRDVSQKAKEVSGVAKLKLDIKSKEDALNKQYMELGRKYYEMNKEGEMPGQDIVNISTLINEIEDLKAEVLKMQGACNCPQCGATLPEGVSFCNKCGTKVN